MGPSVKFVSAIKDAFFNKKNGGQFFSREKDQTGGSEGGLVKDHTFPEIFFLTPSLTDICQTSESFVKSVNLKYQRAEWIVPSVEIQDPFKLEAVYSH